MDNRRFFGLLCAHKWEDVARYAQRRQVGIDRTKDYNWVTVAHKVEQRCRLCGKAQSVRI